MRFGRKSVLKTQVFYVRFVKGCLAQNSNIYSEMKMKLLDKTEWKRVYHRVFAVCPDGCSGRLAGECMWLLLR